MIDEIKSFIAKTLEILFEVKTSTLAVLLAVNYLDLFTKYIFSEFDYLVFLLILIGLDSLAKAYQLLFLNTNNEVFSRDKFFKGNAKKAFKYSIFLIAVHVACNFAVKGDKIEIPKGISMAMYSFLIAIEANSIFTMIGFKTPKIILDLLKVEKKDNQIEIKDDEVKEV